MRSVFSKFPLAGLCAVSASLHALAAAEPQVAAATPAANTAAKVAASSSAKMESFSGPGVLYAPRFSGETVLLDAKGQEAHLWTGGAKGAQSVRMHPDSSILRLAGMTTLPPTFAKIGVEGGRLQRFSWEGSLLWDFPAATLDFMAYGDALVLPNGNVLTAVLEFKTQGECEKAGRDPSLLTERGMFVPGLIEFRPKDKHAGFIVWKWSLWDHLYQARHPALANYHGSGPKEGRVDIGLLPHAKGPVWLAPREIDYHPEQDLILMVVSGSQDLWVIDHSTTSEEATGETGGKRARGGKVARWPAAGVKPEASKGMVSSAEWRRQSGDSSTTAAALVVLHHTKEGSLVDELHLNLDSMAFTTARQLRHDDHAKHEHGQPPPSTVSQGGSGQPLMLGSPLSGRLHFAGTSAAEGWTHQNQKGVVTMLSRPLKPGEACCGAEEDGKSNAAVQAVAQTPPVKIQRAPITKPRVLTMISAPASSPAP